MRACWITIAAAACSQHEARNLEFRWDTKVVCSRSIDDVLVRVPWDHIDRAMAAAAMTHSVLAFHGHVPGLTVSRDAIAHLLDLAAAHHLPSLTFRDLAERRVPTAGIALAFDDNSTAEWEGIADLLAAHGAHATFFVTEWAEMNDAQHAAIHRLAGAGHDIEPHGREHVHAPDFVREHGIDAYLRQELWPSLDALHHDGFPRARAFAYPYGEHTAELDLNVLDHVRLVRVTAAQCPR